jgi:phage terminase Nu1 subunit (DNA packaging protein)
MRNKAKPKSLPTFVSLGELSWLLDLSPSHITGLERDGIVTKTGRDQYELVSVPQYISTMRKRGAAPADWNQARTELAKERALSAKLDRQARERLLIPAAEVRQCWVGIATVIKTKVLGLGAKCAARLAATRTAAEAEAILYAEAHGCLEELSNTVALEGADGKRA